jgi:hypothetical protein
VDRDVNPRNGVSLFSFDSNVCRSGHLFVFGGLATVILAGIRVLIGNFTGDAWDRQFDCDLFAVRSHSCFSSEFA